MGVSLYQILAGLSGLYFANRYIYRTFFNTIPKKKKLAVYLPVTLRYPGFHSEFDRNQWHI